VIRRHPNEANLVYAEVLGSPGTLHECPVDPAHVTADILTDTCADLYGGAECGAYICDVSLIHVIVSEPFSEQLQASGLTGFDTTALEIRENQSNLQDPRLRLMRLTGKECQRHPTIHIPEPNACRFCGWGPVVCEACGFIASYCPNCDEDLLVSGEEHQGPADRRFKQMPLPPEGLILDGQSWDGSDFIVSRGRLGFVTNRAVEWMVSVDAAPFIAKPRRVDVKGLSKQQLEAIHKATVFPW